MHGYDLLMHLVSQAILDSNAALNALKFQAVFAGLFQKRADHQVIRRFREDCALRSSEAHQKNSLEAQGEQHTSLNIIQQYPPSWY